MPRLFRLVHDEHPTETEFQSYWDVGRQPPPDPNARRAAKVEAEYRALSMFRTLEGARAQAQKHPDLGDYVAELEIPEGTRVTGTGDHVQVHDTLPDVVVGWVCSISKVVRESKTK